MPTTRQTTLTRRALLQGLLATVAVPALADGPMVSLRPPAGRGGLPAAAAEDLLGRARLAGDVAFAVADATTGTLLESRNADVAIAPASVTKAITALYALDVLGAGHRFATRIVATGAVDDGVVSGDLVLVGGCDPTTDTERLAELASRMKAAGIREVRGGFHVFDRAIPFVRSIDPDQPDQVGYSPAVSGIALNFNRVHFEWRRNGNGHAVTMDARAGNYRPEVEIARMRVIDRETPIYTYSGSDSRDDWTVARTALGRDGSRWLPVRQPGLYAGEVFAVLARSHGIVLGKPELRTTAPDGIEIARIESEPLGEVLRDMLTYSNNLTAEMVGLATTVAQRGTASDLAQSAGEMNGWARARLGMKTPAFVDHSGLGSGSRVTAADLVQGLGALGHAELLRPLLKPVKLGDRQGQEEASGVQAEAKTGTLNFVSALAGYITTPQSRDLVFAVLASDEETRATLTRAERERPPGGRSYANRARKLQRDLILRWGSVFSAPDAGMPDEG